MRRGALSGLVKRKRGRTPIRVPGVRCAPDLVQRNFRPSAPDRLWVADITYVRTWEGWLYLAAVIDCYPRRVVGWRSPTTCRSWPTKGEARTAIFEFIEAFYNRKRRHSLLGYLAPAQFEQQLPTSEKMEKEAA